MSVFIIAVFVLGLPFLISILTDKGLTKINDMNQVKFTNFLLVDISQFRLSVYREITTNFLLLNWYVLYHAVSIFSALSILVYYMPFDLLVNAGN